MSLKENLNAVKEELSVEEQFLESFIRLERVFKKYKKEVIFIGAVLLFAVFGYVANDYIKESNLKSSNMAYLQLLKNPGDKTALKILKTKNEPLYRAYQFQMAIKDKDFEQLQKIGSSKENSILADIAAYQTAAAKGGQQDISSYADGDKIIMKNIVLLEEGYILIEEGRIEEAKSKFESIPVNSPLKELAKRLQHYKSVKK